MPEAATHAYRNDLADVRLAGRVIASHYAEGMTRRLGRPATLRAGPAFDAQAVSEFVAGTLFELLDDTRGWAWGYAGDDRLVGYVESASLAE